MSACLNCHDLKDRILFDQWPVGLAGQAMLEILGTATDAQESDLDSPSKLVRAVGDYREHWSQWSVAGRLLYAKLSGRLLYVDPMQ